MRSGVVAMMLLAGSGAVGGSALAMNRLADHPWCKVNDAQKLPADVGGAEAVCAAVAKAVGVRSPKPHAITLNIVSPYLISATVTMADGRRLPAIKVGRSDRKLGRRAIQMLADSIAAQVAGQQS